MGETFFSSAAARQELGAVSVIPDDFSTGETKSLYSHLLDSLVDSSEEREQPAISTRLRQRHVAQQMATAQHRPFYPTSFDALPDPPTARPAALPKKQAAPSIAARPATPPNETAAVATVAVKERPVTPPKTKEQENAPTTVDERPATPPSKVSNAPIVPVRTVADSAYNEDAFW